jgi:hypothetical protein
MPQDLQAEQLLESGTKEERDATASYPLGYNAKDV